MDISVLYDKYEQMKDLMGADALLEELVQGMSSEELEENLRWVDKNNDLDFF